MKPIKRCALGATIAGAAIFGLGASPAFATIPVQPATPAIDTPSGQAVSVLPSTGSASLLSTGSQELLQLFTPCDFTKPPGCPAP